MILVAGGTGRLGSLVVRQLRGDGHPVRVLTRDPARAVHLSDTGVEVVCGDVRIRSDVTAAVRGADVVVSAVQGFAGPGRVTPATVDRDGNAALIDAAAEGGADVVLMSIVGASSEHPLELLRMKAAAEERLRVAGAPWTIVRATAYAELHLELMRTTAGKSGRPLVFGRGENPINFVSVRDVAAVATRAIVDRSLRGQILEVTGPDNLTFNQMAALAQRQLGAPTRPPRHVPRPLLRTLAATARVRPSTLARQAATALVMDTTDMTAPPAAPVALPPGQLTPVTSLAGP